MTSYCSGSRGDFCDCNSLQLHVVLQFLLNIEHYSYTLEHPYTWSSDRQLVGGKQLKMLMKIHQEKDDLSPEELKECQTIMQTMSSISEAVRWDNDKHKVRAT